MLEDMVLEFDENAAYRGILAGYRGLKGSVSRITMDTKINLKIKELWYRFDRMRNLTTNGTGM